MRKGSDLTPTSLIEIGIESQTLIKNLTDFIVKIQSNFTKKESALVWASIDKLEKFYWNILDDDFAEMVPDGPGHLLPMHTKKEGCEVVNCPYCP